MRREPSLTFEGALRILGQHEEPKWIKKLDAVLGGALLAGGAVGTIAAGPAALPALGMFAAVWGWLEPKDQAIELIKQGAEKLPGKLAGTTGYERRKLIAAAHTTIVVAAFIEALRERAGSTGLWEVKLSDAKIAEFVADRSRLEGTGLVTHTSEESVVKRPHIGEQPGAGEHWKVVVRWGR